MSANDDADDADDVDDGSIDLLVPSRFSIARPRRDDDDSLGPFSWQRWLRRAVIVRANGFTVRGQLHGVDEESLYLRGELRWFVLPLATITSVVRDPEADADDGRDDDDD